MNLIQSTCTTVDEEPLVTYPFTTKADEVIKFMRTVEAMGGGDPPEDVHGGIEVSCISFSRMFFLGEILDPRSSVYH